MIRLSGMEVGAFRPFGFEPLRIWGHCQGIENI